MNNDCDYENGQKPGEEGRVHGRNISHDLATSSHIERGSDRDRGYIYHTDGSVERITGYPEMYPTSSNSSYITQQLATYRCPIPVHDFNRFATNRHKEGHWEGRLIIWQHFIQVKSRGLEKVLDQLVALYDGIETAERRLKRGVGDAFEYKTNIQKWKGSAESLQQQYSVSKETVRHWKTIRSHSIILTKKKHKTKKPVERNKHQQKRNSVEDARRRLKAALISWNYAASGAGRVPDAVKKGAANVAALAASVFFAITPEGREGLPPLSVFKDAVTAIQNGARPSREARRALRQYLAAIDKEGCSGEGAKDETPRR